MVCTPLESPISTYWSLRLAFAGVPALPPTFLGYAHFSEHPYYSYGGHLYFIPSSENECTYFKVESPLEEPVLFGRGGHNYYGARDMERLQRRMKPIFSEIAPTPQAPSRLGSLQLRGRRTLSDGLKNKRLEELSKPHEQRSTSLPESSDEVASLDDGCDPDPPDILMNPGVDRQRKSWIEGYLKREKEEEVMWMKENKQATVWGALQGVVSFGVFKKA
jgi:hypothetical protein